MTTVERHAAWWPCKDGWETSEGIKWGWDRNSKIRARQSTRNEASYTGHAADGRASATREQQVSPQLVGHKSRHPPVPALPRLAMAYAILQYSGPADSAPSPLSIWTV